MEIPTIHVFTHDSIGVGEDGPTHQPIEQLASLRAIPGLIIIRPADANEVVEAWRVIMALSTSRPCWCSRARPSRPSTAPGTPRPRGGQGRATSWPTPTDGKPEVILLATGSEVSLCVEAFEQLTAEGIQARVVSMPSWELFEQQSHGVPGRAFCRPR